MLSAMTESVVVWIIGINEFIRLQHFVIKLLAAATLGWVSFATHWAASEAASDLLSPASQVWWWINIPHLAVLGFIAVITAVLAVWVAGWIVLSTLKGTHLRHNLRRRPRQFKPKKRGGYAP